MSDTPAQPQVKPRKRAKARPARRRKVKRLPPWNVVLLDDDAHTYPYVVELMSAVFGFDKAKGFQIAREVDSRGRAVVYTAHKELAELKRDQILGYGADWRIPTCKGSMTAVIEPAAKQ